MQKVVFCAFNRISLTVTKGINSCLKTCLNLPSGQNCQKKQSEGVRFLLFRHSKCHVPCCQKDTPTDCFFGRFFPLGMLL